MSDRIKESSSNRSTCMMMGVHSFKNIISQKYMINRNTQHFFTKAMKLAVWLPFSYIALGA